MKLTHEQIEAIMDQAQVFASAWSLLGGPFDAGNGLETAEREKAALRDLLVSQGDAELSEDVQPAIGQHDLNTSAGGRGYIAEFFARRLRRHDFSRYINERLAADFACALAQYLTDHEAALASKAAAVAVGEPNEQPCVHADNPRACYRVRCQLGNKCVDDAMSFRAKAPLAPIASTEEAPVLDKPAKVGGTRFGKGVKWSTVIGAAQRLYEYDVTPEKEAARIERARATIESIQRGDTGEKP